MLKFVKNLFSKENTETKELETKEPEVSLDELKEESEIYQKICAYIERNKDKGFENDFINVKNGKTNFGIITISYFYKSYYIDINGQSFGHLLDNRLIKDISEKINDLYYKFLGKKEEKDFEEALKMLDE